MAVTIKTAEQMERMRAAGRAAATVLDFVEELVRPGVTTGELNERCHQFMLEELNVVPAPLNYKGFPKSICTSVNNVICHGIPGDKALKAGDIINVDITVIKDGYHGDTSRMFHVGEVSILAQRLCTVARDAMLRAIELVRPGTTLGDIGHEIQSYVESQRFSVVREYCGHGIGEVFHEDPHVLHYGTPGSGLALVEGMTFTIEPMVNAGARHTRLLPDGWTVVTRDRSLSAQWEHTVAVTSDGYEILTVSPRAAMP